MTLAAMLLLVAIGFCAGGFGALAGVGGGIIVTPLLAIYFGLPMHQAIGVTLLCVIATSTATSSMYVERHVTDVRLGMTLELGDDRRRADRGVGGASRESPDAGSAVCLLSALQRRLHDQEGLGFTP